MRKIFAGLAALLALAVVAQFFLAASGAFDTAPNDEAFQPHRMLGYVIFILAVLLTIVAALARMPGRLVGMAGLVAGLVVLQVVIAELAKAFDDGDNSTTAGKLVFGLHAVNGLAIMSVAGLLARRARALPGPAVTDRPADARRSDAGVSGPAGGPAQSAS